MDRGEELKSLIKPLRLSMYDFREKDVKNQLSKIIDEHAIINLSLCIIHYLILNGAII